jgi:ApbE superfamily uncharacterized protein (UPF0280 family)
VPQLHQELSLWRLHLDVLKSGKVKHRCRYRFEHFSWKGAAYRISARNTQRIKDEIVKQRTLLEMYIEGHPEFLTALAPIAVRTGAPPIAREMADAARAAGVGPMAAVAGAMAQWAAGAASSSPGEGIVSSSPGQGVISQEDGEVIVENGGDIYLNSSREVIVGIYTGPRGLSDRLAVLVGAESMPMAICSSSSHMGHSMSLGHCQLASIVSKNAALADAVATAVCNSVHTASDIQGMLDKTMMIPGVQGVLIVEEGHVGLAGEFPTLVRHGEEDLTAKIFSDTAV